MTARFPIAILTVALVGGVLDMAAPVMAQKKQQTIVVNLAIHDANSAYPGASSVVLPDVVDESGPRSYLDYRVSGGDVCVQGESYTHGLASVVMNRQWAVGDEVKRCGWAGNPTRTFKLRLEHEGACNLLAEASDQPFDQTFTEATRACIVSVLSADKGPPVRRQCEIAGICGRRLTLNISRNTA